MKKKTPLQLFVHVFLKSVIIMAAVLGAGFGSYKLTMYYYRSEKPPADEKVQGAILDLINDVPVENIEKTLIYHIDSQSGEIRHMVLELFHTDTYNLDFITIPPRMQFELSPELYQKLSAAAPGVPQIVTMNQLSRYVSGDTAYEYGMVFLKDFLGTDIHYYAVLEDAAYNKIFRTKKREISYEAAPDESGVSPGRRTMTGSVQIFRKTFLSRLGLADSEDKLTELMSSLCREVKVSSLSEKNRLKYVPDYLKVNRQWIHYHILYGQFAGGRFTPDLSSGELLKELEDNTAPYQGRQQETEAAGGQASAGLNIRILNGSGITGLAALYQKKLTDDGYTVTGIGNYASSAEQTTRILVRQEGTGGDLLRYFDHAVLTTGETAEGNDIEIILGKNDGE